MAHRRKPLAVALALNTLVIGAEIAGGIAANSLSLVVDGIHNVSDEAALVMLVLAYSLRTGLSRRFLLPANLFNSLGLAVISGFMILEGVERLSRPTPVIGLVPVVAGLLGAAGNWWVARVLREPSADDAAIRLAYVHNLGDTLLSLGPAGAGALVLVFHRAIFDPIAAILIAGFILVTTIGSVIASREELLWPDNVRCGHSETAT